MNSSVTPAAVNLSMLKEDGRYLLQALDAQTAVFVPVTAQIIANSPFLDKRIALPENAPRYRVPVRALIDKAPAQTAGPSRYLMHTSHVGSTLISRALGFADDTVSLREPLPIRFLSQVRTQLDEGRFRTESMLSWPAYLALQQQVLALLNRPLEGQHRILVKCTSWANNMADTLLMHAQETPRVVGISTGLEEFVANMLKSPGAQQDLHNGAPARLRRLALLLPGYEPVLCRLSAGELAASAWLVELLSMQQGAAAASTQVYWLNFDEYLLAPVEQTVLLATHLDLPWRDACSQALVNSGLLGRYSKTAVDKPFDAQARAAILTDFKSRHGDVMIAARRWVNEMLTAYPGLARRLPNWAC